MPVSVVWLLNQNTVRISLPAMFSYTNEEMNSGLYLISVNRHFTVKIYPDLRYMNVFNLYLKCPVSSCAAACIAN